MINKSQTPQERLKKKLYKIDISENTIRVRKRDFNPKEFIKRAKAVKRTFKDENISFSEPVQ